MKCLLDTQAFLWFLLDDKRLGTTARTTIEQTEILYLNPRYGGHHGYIDPVSS